MIIDIHTHTFPEKIVTQALKQLSGNSHTVPFTDGTVNGLLASQKKAGIDLSVILPVATAARQVMHINDSAADINRRYAVPLPAADPAPAVCSAPCAAESSGSDGSRTGARALPALLSFASMHPELENWEEELDSIAALGFKGIKIHPVYQDVSLDEPLFLRILHRCGQLGLYVITHTGFDIGYPDVVRCSPEMALRALDKAGPFTFILAHMGGWREWEKVVPLLSGTGVYLDTAFSTGHFTPVGDGFWKPEDTAMLDEKQFADLARDFGADHVLFGTDSPWSDQSESLAFIRRCPLTDEEKELILGKNAAGLLL